MARPIASHVGQHQGGRPGCGVRQAARLQCGGARRGARHRNRSRSEPGFTINGGDATVSVFDTATVKTITKMSVPKDPDFRFLRSGHKPRAGVPRRRRHRTLMGLLSSATRARTFLPAAKWKRLPPLPAKGPHAAKAGVVQCTSGGKTVRVAARCVSVRRWPSAFPYRPASACVPRPSPSGESVDTTNSRCLPFDSPALPAATWRCPYAHHTRQRRRRP